MSRAMTRQEWLVYLKKAIEEFDWDAEHSEKPVAWTDENFTELIVSEDIAKDIGATVPLYTAPPKQEPEPVIDKSAAIRIATSLGWTPKREWHGLTDWEINSVANNNNPLDGIRSFARAIEAKLKEKNT